MGVVEVLSKKCKSCGADTGIDEYFCPACGEAMFAEDPISRDNKADEVVNAASSMPEQSGVPPARNPIPAAFEPQQSTPQPSKTTAEEPQMPPTPQAQYTQPVIRGAASPHASPAGMPPVTGPQATTPPAPYGDGTAQYSGGYRQAGYPQYQQPGRPPIASPTGQAYNRVQLRRLIEEDKRKRKKILFISIPAFLVVGCIIALLLMFLVFGGLSPEEYKQKANQINSKAMAEFDIIEHDWDRSDVNDDPYSVGYEKLTGDVQLAVPVLQEAQTELNALQPPKETAALHEELSIFYDNMSEYLDRAEPVFTFAKEWSRIWESSFDKPVAMENVKSTSSPAEVVALMDQDIATVSGVIAEFNALNPPADCKNMATGVVSLLGEQKGLMERMKTAVINYDPDAYDAVLADWDIYDSTVTDKIHKLWDDLNSFRNEFWSLVDEGKSLQRKLGATGEEEVPGEQVTQLFDMFHPCFAAS
jgi:predicted RNA-binding Zn-ribbon protein involved in translation (DUF1610 family)